MKCQNGCGVKLTHKNRRGVLVNNVINYTNGRDASGKPKVVRTEVKPLWKFYCDRCVKQIEDMAVARHAVGDEPIKVVE